jgi:dihydroorotate dehydrogenase
MPRIVGSIGFGFQSVGTVTNGVYHGNPYPRIKRLVRSRTMLVYKGFKSTGMSAVLARLKGQTWRVPIGISIGRTNPLAEYTHQAAIADIIEAFTKARDSEIPFSYFELNISCPNMLYEISFYEPENLSPLLTALRDLKLPKPLFIKMPIGLQDDATKALLDTIMQFPVAAVIFGNLQVDRTNPEFHKEELETLAKYPGNWSGMPCQKRSDHLVRLAYNHTKGKLAIIGCGGVFNAKDAYRKIRNGASLVQLVTATVFEGPQVPAEICADLPALLARDGFKHVAEAVGVDADAS